MDDGENSAAIAVSPTAEEQISESIVEITQVQEAEAMVRRDRRSTPTYGLGGLLLGVMGLAGCGAALDMGAIEQDIKADIERQGRRLTLREVRCPDDVTPQAGAYFRCVGELDPEGTFTINVVQDNSQGHVSWDIPNSRAILNLAKVEANIQEGLTKAFSQRALVDCGSELYRANQPGDRFECAIVGGMTAGASQIDAVLVRVDPDGNLNWQEIRQSSPTAAIAGASTTPTSASTEAGAARAATAPTANPGPAGVEPTSAPVKTTTVTGPSGRKIERPYVPGDDD